MLPIGWRSFLSPASPETRVILFFGLSIPKRKQCFYIARVYLQRRHYTTTLLRTVSSKESFENFSYKNNDNNNAQTKKQAHKTIWYNKILNRTILKYYSIWEVTPAISMDVKITCGRTLYQQTDKPVANKCSEKTTPSRISWRLAKRQIVQDHIRSHKQNLSAVE